MSDPKTDSLKYLGEALDYLTAQGKEIQPLENWLYDGEKMYYLWNNILWEFRVIDQNQFPLVIPHCAKEFK